MDLDQSPSSKHQAVGGCTEPQEFVHHPMLDTWVATRSIYLVFQVKKKPFGTFQLFNWTKKIQIGSIPVAFWVVYLLVACCNQPSSKGWLVGPVGVRSPTLGTRGSRRPAAASAQCLWEAGDTRRPGGLCRAAGAQGGGVESQKPKPVWQLLQLSGVLKVGLRDGKWWNLKFIYAMILVWCMHIISNQYTGNVWVIYCKSIVRT